MYIMKPPMLHLMCAVVCCGDSVVDFVITASGGVIRHGNGLHHCTHPHVGQGTIVRVLYYPWRCLTSILRNQSTKTQHERDRYLQGTLSSYIACVGGNWITICAYIMHVFQLEPLPMAAHTSSEGMLIVLGASGANNYVLGVKIQYILVV